jgi:hypothetical protein
MAVERSSRQYSAISTDPTHIPADEQTVRQLVLNAWLHLIGLVLVLVLGLSAITLGAVAEYYNSKVSTVLQPLLLKRSHQNLIGISRASRAGPSIGICVSSRDFGALNEVMS